MGSNSIQLTQSVFHKQTQSLTVRFRPIWDISLLQFVWFASKDISSALGIRANSTTHQRTIPIVQCIIACIVALIVPNVVFVLLHGEFLPLDSARRLQIAQPIASFVPILPLAWHVTPASLSMPLIVVSLVQFPTASSVNRPMSVPHVPPASR